MKKKIIFIPLALLSAGIIFIISSAYAGYTKWEKDITRHNIRFEKLRYSVSDGDTNCVIGFLKENTRIENYPIKASWVHFSKNWELEMFCLSDTATIHGVLLHPNCWIVHNTNDKYLSVVFPNDTIVNGYPCKGGGGPKGARTRFHNNGQLRSFFSNETVVIDGIACKGGSFHPVLLHENGKLESAKLAEPYEYNGQKIKKGKVITIDANGKITAK